MILVGVGVVDVGFAVVVVVIVIGVDINGVGDITVAGFIAGVVDVDIDGVGDHVGDFTLALLLVVDFGVGGSDVDVLGAGVAGILRDAEFLKVAVQIIVNFYRID